MVSGPRVLPIIAELAEFCEHVVGPFCARYPNDASFGRHAFRNCSRPQRGEALGFVSCARHAIIGMGYRVHRRGRRVVR